LIEFDFWDACKRPDDGTDKYENGFIVLIQPSWYFETKDADEELRARGIELGVNALLLFRKRADWTRYAPTDGMLPNGKQFNIATSRIAPLDGTYFARIHGTVSVNKHQMVDGFNTTTLRGAGIRVYEYASSATISATRLQLEALMWLCHDSEKAMNAANMSDLDIQVRKIHQLRTAEQQGLLDYSRLHLLRMIDNQNRTVCPLCQRIISAADFLKRGVQAEGRETYDLTITELSLFHIQELRVGKFQHKKYNLGWGHHFCNVVVKDEGIVRTLAWMKEVLDNQRDVKNLETEAKSIEEAIDS